MRGLVSFAACIVGELRISGYAHILALGDGVEVDLDLGHGQNVSRGGHVDEEF